MDVVSGTDTGHGSEAVAKLDLGSAITGIVSAAEDRHYEIRPVLSVTVRSKENQETV